MARFDIIDKQVVISDEHGSTVHLTPLQALHLLQWLSDSKHTLYSFTFEPGGSAQSGAKRLEIRLHQEDLEHLDELKAAIPNLQEHKADTQEPETAVTVFTAQWDSIVEHAIQLLKKLQIEYKLHPLLEDNDTFAQA